MMIYTDIIAIDIDMFMPANIRDNTPLYVSNLVGILCISYRLSFTCSVIYYNYLDTIYCS